jgi:ferredoxin
VDAIQLIEDKAMIGEDCRGCGRCVEVCPNGAIELTIRGNMDIDQTIERLSRKVHVQ